MAKATLKTTQNTANVESFIAAVEHPQRREDAQTLLALFNRVSGLEARMWGNSIVGYGRYHYKYDSGREGEFFLIGFSPRKASMTIYIMPGYRDLSEMLDRLGKHKLGKSCLYINKLKDVDLAVVEELVLYGLEYMRNNYETWDE
ncbi:MAG: DUF1801 domain-containing protein [Arenicella sp.]